MHDASLRLVYSQSTSYVLRVYLFSPPQHVVFPIVRQSPRCTRGCCGQGTAPCTTLILTNTSGVEPSRFADSNCSSQRHSPCVAFTIPPPQHCMSIPCCHSVFIRTLPPYLTLPLRQAPTCHGSGRDPDELTEHHRTESLQRTALLSFIPFCEVMNKE